MASIDDFFAATGFEDVFKILSGKQAEEDVADELEADILGESDGINIGGFTLKVGAKSIDDTRNETLHSKNALLSDDLLDSKATSNIIQKILAGKDITAMDFIK